MSTPINFQPIQEGPEWTGAQDAVSSPSPRAPLNEGRRDLPNGGYPRVSGVMRDTRYPEQRRFINRTGGPSRLKVLPEAPQEPRQHRFDVGRSRPQSQPSSQRQPMLQEGTEQFARAKAHIGSLLTNAEQMLREHSTQQFMERIGSCEVKNCPGKKAITEGKKTLKEVQTACDNVCPRGFDPAGMTDDGKQCKCYSPTAEPRTKVVPAK